VDRFKWSKTLLGRHVHIYHAHWRPHDYTDELNEAASYAPQWLKSLLAISAATTLLWMLLVKRLSLSLLFVSTLVVLFGVLFLISLGLVDVLLIIDASSLLYTYYGLLCQNNYVITTKKTKGGIQKKEGFIQA